APTWGLAVLKALYMAAALSIGPLAHAAAPGDDPTLAQTGDEAPARAWSWFGDVMLRGDRVTDIPRAGDDSFSRTFGRGRFGVLYDPVPTLEFGAAIKLAASSQDNATDRIDNFEERSNDVALDQAFVRWRPGENTALLAGKAVFPLELSPLV